MSLITIFSKPHRQSMKNQWTHESFSTLIPATALCVFVPTDEKPHIACVGISILFPLHFPTASPSPCHQCYSVSFRDGHWLSNQQHPHLYPGVISTIQSSGAHTSWLIPHSCWSRAPFWSYSGVFCHLWIPSTLLPSAHIMHIPAPHWKFHSKLLFRHRDQTFSAFGR